MADYLVSERDVKEFKPEITLDVTEFRKNRILESKEAIAKCVQNLLFFRKGNFPNQPELGIGIEDYMFELGDQTLLNELENTINQQISQFIDREEVNIDVTLKLVKNSSSKGKNNNLIIYVNIYSDKDEGNNNKIDEENLEDFSFSLLLSGNKYNRKVSSKIIIN